MPLPLRFKYYVAIVTRFRLISFLESDTFESFCNKELISSDEFEVQNDALSYLLTKVTINLMLRWSRIGVTCLRSIQFIRTHAFES